MHNLFHEEILKKLDQILDAIKKLIKLLGAKKWPKKNCSKFFLFLIFLSLNSCAFLTTAAGSLVGNVGADIISEKLDNNLKKAQQCGE